MATALTECEKRAMVVVNIPGAFGARTQSSQLASPRHLAHFQGWWRVRDLSPGQMVRLARAATGWTLTDLAGAAGISKSLLSRVENHSRSLTPRVAQRLLTALERGRR